jgi:hypothetical protein
MKTIARIDNERVVEGLRIPPSLDSLATVNFVLTQEPGKLKPKDLKLAIERNRAEKALRAEEQNKIREEGGGAGTLDLRGILAEERMNSGESDPFKRQLREMAFLADVDDVAKQEIEKGFRISEDFSGSNILSNEDIASIFHQRAIAHLHKKRTEWRGILSRQKTVLYPPNHPYIKGGTSSESGAFVLTNLVPLYDPNRNDVWAKRINTLRRFISIVSRWINQNRVKRRMDKVKALFARNGAFTREDVLAFIIAENEANRKAGSSKAVASGPSGEEKSLSVRFNTDALNANTVAKAKPASVAVMVLEKPNGILTNREYNDSIISAANASASADSASFDMVRRILFPKPSAVGGTGQSKAEIASAGIQSPIAFDDRTVFQLKIRPQYVTLGYSTQSIPAVPVYFPPCSDKMLRSGAFEELALRPPADGDVPLDTVSQWLVTPPAEPAAVSQLRGAGMAMRVAAAAKFFAKTSELTHSAKTDTAAADVVPSWMNVDASWSQAEVNFFAPVASFRNYVSGPRRCELDNDWVNRPNSETLVYVAETSLRSR